MDPITTVAYELQPAAPTLAGASLGGAGSAAMFDISHFDALYAAAGQAQSAAAQQAPKVAATESDGFRAVMSSLESLNGHADALGARAVAMGAGELKPADMLMMTMKAHEFLFHCELTSNVANRTSEGVQQLFREQS